MEFSEVFSVVKYRGKFLEHKLTDFGLELSVWTNEANIDLLDERPVIAIFSEDLFVKKLGQVFVVEVCPNLDFDLLKYLSSFRVSFLYLLFLIRKSLFWNLVLLINKTTILSPVFKVR